MRKTELVKDGRTLRMLERAGFIKEPTWCSPENGSWGVPKRSTERHYCYVDDGSVEAPCSFQHKGVDYRLDYRDGCFCPFVFRVTKP